MKSSVYVLVFLLVACSGRFVQQAQAAPLGTGFTYQGRLNDGNDAANGLYDLRFALFDAATLGGQVGDTITNEDVVVTRGLFTVQLDFGPNAFTGGARWLEIGVRPGVSIGNFTPLDPRQRLTPAPHAIYASNADVERQRAAAAEADLQTRLDTETANRNVVEQALTLNLSGEIARAATAENTLANNLNSEIASRNGADATLAARLDAEAARATAAENSRWSLTGNGGTTAGAQFLGTIDSQPLELKVNGQRALRLEPTPEDGNHFGIVNVVGGSSANYLAPGVYGATISGGGATLLFAGAYSNSISADFGTISGGSRNTIERFSESSSICGGSQNTIQLLAGSSTIVGGDGNTIQTNASFSVIAGGQANVVQQSALFSAIGGGLNNMVSDSYSVVPGGYGNAAGRLSFAAGTRAKATHSGAFAWADSTGADFATTGDNQFLVRATGGVGIGINDPAFTLDVGGRMRVRDGGGTAGIWLNTFFAPNGGNANIGFVGVLDSTRIGFYGNDPRGAAGWGLTFDTATGNVGIGTGAAYPSYKLQVNGSVAGVGAYNNLSDARFKKNVAELTNALEMVERVRGVRYEWRDSEFPSMHFEQGPQLGFIAQELKAVLPEAVSVDAEGVHSVAYSKVIPVLVEAVKEERKQVEGLRRELVELRQLVDSLKAKPNQRAE